MGQEKGGGSADVKKLRVGAEGLALGLAGHGRSKDLSRSFNVRARSFQHPTEARVARLDPAEDLQAEQMKWRLS